MRSALLVCVLALCAVTTSAQTPVKNPTAIWFNSADHDLAAVTGYEVDFLNATTSAVVQTVSVAKASTTKQADGSIRVTMNVQPVAFGTYRFVARTVAGAIKSDNSLATEVWERSPGAPSKPTVQ